MRKVQNGRRKNHAFPIEWQEFKLLLQKMRVGKPYESSYFYRTNRAVLLAAIFTGDKLRQHPNYNEATTWPKAGKFRITLFSVEPEQRPRAETLLKTEALPLLTEWMNDAEKKGENWYLNDHNLIFRFVGDSLVMEENVKWAGYFGV